MSKSISNRFLIAKALRKEANLNLAISKAEDSVILDRSIANLDSKINVGRAGTALRFLTAYLSTIHREFVLDGDSRMRERPIGVLVDHLRELGAVITYLGRKGFPPLQIKGGELKAKKMKIDATVSSQFISALMLIAPALEGTSEFELKGKIVSSPYIDMTLKLMSAWGIELSRKGANVLIKSGAYAFDSDYTIESDWSSAAFIYQAFTLSKGRTLVINDLSLNSLQGDKQIAALFKMFGIETSIIESGVALRKTEFKKKAMVLDMLEVPDLIPAIVVTAAALDVPLKIIGVSTLKDKESNRLEALKRELFKFNSILEYDDDSLLLKSSIQFKKGIAIETYNDHRIAMAFAPLATLGDIVIDNPMVVNKSFPNYWDELKKMGIEVEVIPN